MRKTSLRVVLPVAAFLVSVALAVWEQYTAWRCIFYDAGRPFWKCDAPGYFLGFLCGPMLVVAHPLANVWQTAPWFFTSLIRIPLIALWWWFLGTRLDFGLLGTGSYKRRRTWITVQISVSVLLLTLFALSIWEDLAFYRNFSWSASNPWTWVCLNFRALPHRLWSLSLAAAFALAAYRLIRNQVGSSESRLFTLRGLRIPALCFALYCMLAAALSWHAWHTEQLRQAEYERHRIKLQGRVLDDQGRPAYAMMVSLIRVSADGKVSENESAYDFTNREGEYSLSPEEAGSYLLVAGWNKPPSAKLPYLPRYFPDATGPEHAETLVVTPELHRSLPPFRLHPLPVARIPVTIVWSTGQPEPRAYVLPTNPLFPHSGVVGDESMHPEADGTIALPSGYTYVASAQLECDEGQKIGNAFTEQQEFTVDPAHKPIQPLHFVLPGEPCKPWVPK